MADGGGEMTAEPTVDLSVRDLFGIDTGMTVKGFAEILEGKHDNVPEQAFYMVGGIEDVLRRAAELAKAA